MTIITKDDSSVELMLGTACSELVRLLAMRGEVDTSLHLKKLSMQSILADEPIHTIATIGTYKF